MKPKDGGAQGVLRNAAVLAIARIVDRLATFVVVLFIAPTLGATGLGIYATAMALYGVIAIAGYAGTTQYLVRELSREPSVTAGHTVHLSVVGLLLGVLLTAGTLLVVPYLGYSEALTASVSVILLALVPKILNTIQEAVFLAHGRVAFETFTRFLSSSVYVVSAAVLLSRGYGIATVLSVYVILEYGVATVYFVLINRYVTRLRARFEWSYARRLITEMRTFTAASALSALFARPEIVILSLLASESQVGLYSAAIRIAELPLFLPDVFMANVFPRLSAAFRVAEDRFALWYASSVRAIAAFAFPLAAVLLASAGELILLLYGDGFEKAALLLQILTVTLTANSFAAVFWRVLPARGRQDKVLVTQCAVIGFRFSAGLAIIALYAATGAAVTGAASTALNATLLGVFVARSGARLSILPLVARFALAAAVCGLTVWATLQWLPLPAAYAAGAIAYPAALLLLGALTREERRLLIGAVPRRRRAAAGEA